MSIIRFDVSSICDQTTFNSGFREVNPLCIYDNGYGSSDIANRADFTETFLHNMMTCHGTKTTFTYLDRYIDMMDTKDVDDINSIIRTLCYLFENYSDNSDFPYLEEMVINSVKKITNIFDINDDDLQEELVGFVESLKEYGVDSKEYMPIINKISSLDNLSQFIIDNIKEITED